MRILIRADASPCIGTGHVMRCMALAMWARQKGVDVSMTGYVSVPWVRERLAKEGIAFHFLEMESENKLFLTEMLDIFGPAGQSSWVVLDGYHFTTSSQRSIREAGFKLLLIDDYAHLQEYCCDILLNQNIGAEKLVYHGNIDRKLLGPKNALLRPEFVIKREQDQKRKFLPTPDRILLSLGGGEASLHMQKIVSQSECMRQENIHLRVIQGSMPAESIHQALQNVVDTVEILSFVEDMPSLLSWADLCITAAGSTCWEICCLGVPFSAVSIADNQRLIAENLNAQGISLPVKCGQSSDERRVSSERGLALVDGRGAQRVLQILEGQ